MEEVVDFLRRHRDLLWKIAVGATLLSIFYPVFVGYYTWLGGDHVFSDHPKLSFWILSDYFFDPLIAAIVLGALLQRWTAVYVAIVGLVAALILLTGTIITDDAKDTVLAQARQLDVSKFQGYLQAYLVSILRWAWILGLIAFGVALGRKVGDFFGELGEPPAESPPAS